MYGQSSFSAFQAPVSSSSTSLTSSLSSSWAIYSARFLGSGDLSWPQSNLFVGFDSLGAIPIPNPVPSTSSPTPPSFASVLFFANSAAFGSSSPLPSH